MKLTIGSSRMRNTDGIITVRGSKQIILEWGAFSSQLLLTMDLYGTGGRHVARLRRNAWTFNDYERFQLTANTRGFSLFDTKSEQIVLEARVLGGDSVVITQGAFHNSDGNQIEIATEDWTATADSRTSTEPAAQSTKPPFAAQDIAAIRDAVLLSQESVSCPQCGCPLTTENITDKARSSCLLVSCIMCRRNLVVRSES